MMFQVSFVSKGEVGRFCIRARNIAHAIQLVQKILRNHQEVSKVITVVQ